MLKLNFNIKLSIIYYLLSTIYCLCGCATIIKDLLPPPQQIAKGVLFQLYAQSAKTVLLAGEFNGWEHKPDQARTIKLKKTQTASGELK